MYPDISSKCINGIVFTNFAFIILGVRQTLLTCRHRQDTVNRQMRATRKRRETQILTYS